MQTTRGVRRYTTAVAIVVTGFSLFYLAWPGTIGPLFRRPPARPLDGPAIASPAADDDGDDE